MSSDAPLPTSTDSSHTAGDEGECPLPVLESDFKETVASAKATLAEAQAYLDQVQREGLA